MITLSDAHLDSRATPARDDWRQKPPTAKQLSEIARLAPKRGVELDRPATRGEASEQIALLNQAQPWQHRKLRRLAESRGMSFTPPQTFKDANEQIARMEKTAPSSSAERAADRRAVQDAMRPGVPERVAEPNDRPASQAQKTTLQGVCRRRGLTYVEPATMQEASEQIGALLASGPKRLAASEQDEGLLPASSVTDEEVVGFGAIATCA